MTRAWHLITLLCVTEERVPVRVRREIDLELGGMHLEDFGEVEELKDLVVEAGQLKLDRILWRLGGSVQHLISAQVVISWRVGSAPRGALHRQLRA